MSEGFVFAVAGGAVLFEMNRADRIKAADSEVKKAKEAVEKAALEARLVSIEEALARLEAQAREKKPTSSTAAEQKDSQSTTTDVSKGRGWWPALFSLR